MLNKVNIKVYQLAQKLAGDKFDIVLIRAEELVAEGKKPERALADSLEQLKLV